MQIRNNIIILIGVSIMLSLLYIYRLIIDQPADKVLSPPPLTPRTTLTYQYRLCSDDRPCSPMREYYVSSMCYGYLDALSNTGSPGILGIQDTHSFSGGEDSDARYVCNIGGSGYETFFLYFF